MKIFLSHSHRDKPLVREVLSHLPSHVKSWIDEKDLLIGDDIGASLKDAIQAKSDFVIIFVGKESVESDWVKKELAWALEHEKKLQRVFVLPVLLDKNIWNSVQPEEFRRRKYLECYDYSESGIKTFTKELESHLFAWLSRSKDEEKDKDETAGIENIFKSIGMASDIFSKKYIPPLIEELNHYRNRGMQEEVVIDNVRKAIDRIVNELSDTFSEFTAKGNGASEEDQFSKNAFMTIGMGGGLLRNSLSALLESIDRWLKIGKNHSEIILEMEAELKKLNEPTRTK